MTKARTHIAAIAPYALAKLDPPDGKPLISLSQNEGFRPPSPKAIEAAGNALVRSMLYPDPDWTKLRHAIAHVHGIPVHGILCGNGSLDLIGAISRVFAGPEGAVLAPVHSYPFFRTAAQLAEARFDTAPEEELTVSVSNLLDAVKPDTGLVFVANPGNPTGTRIPKSELQRLRRGLRDDILLVVDEAYGEFADHLNESCFDMVDEGNTIVLRTFSKAYGLAGARAGWGLFPPTIAAEIRKVLNPNNIAAASQAAAEAAILDQDHMRETCAVTAGLREQAAVELRAAGFKVYPSFTNFLLISFADEMAAALANSALISEGIFLRAQGGAGLPNALRMTIAEEVKMAPAIEKLINWKREQG